MEGSLKQYFELDGAPAQENGADSMSKGNMPSEEPALLEKNPEDPESCPMEDAETA